MAADIVQLRLPIEGGDDGHRLVDLTAVVECSCGAHIEDTCEAGAIVRWIQHTMDDHA